MRERTREFSTIESIDDLKALLDLLHLPMYKSKKSNKPNLIPINFKNVAVEKAKIKYCPRDFTFRNAESTPVEKRVYVFGISSMREPDDYFDYLIFSEDKKVLENFDDAKVTTLRNLLEYKTLEELK